MLTSARERQRPCNVYGAAQEAAPGPDRGLEPTGRNGGDADQGNEPRRGSPGEPFDRVLATGLEVADAARYERTVAGLGYRFEVVVDPQEAAQRLERERFDAVISAYPLSPGALGFLVGAMRSRKSLNLASGLVLLARPESLRAASGLVGRGVNKVLSTEEDPAVLGVVLRRLVESSRPMAERLPLHLELSTSGGGNGSWHTENISGGGVLVGTDRPPPVGTRFSFVLHTPQRPIRGEAKVVRHTSAERESVDGFGARFCAFADDGQARLLAFLRTVRRNEPGGERSA